jgi:hypothetical protein
MKKANYQIFKSEEEAQRARYIAAANSTYTERFYTLMKLIKISKMISGMKIISSPEMKNNENQ